MSHDSNVDAVMSLEAPSKPGLGEAARIWWRIGLLSFGGPAGQIALMHTELVERRRWIGEQRFLHALSYCMLLPGPEAQQLAVYIGWLMHRTVGGLIAGLLFILPGAVVMLGLSLLYVDYRDMPLVDAAFFGVKAAVLAVVLQAGLRIGTRALRGPVAAGVAIASFLALFLFRVPFPLVVLGAGLVGWFGACHAPAHVGTVATKAGVAMPESGEGVVEALIARGEAVHVAPSRGRALLVLALWLPLWLAPVVLLHLLRGQGDVFAQIATLFSTMALVTFGGAYAALSYVAQAAVETYGWLSAAEMLDGLGLAETTPGPLILVLQFVGFLAAARAPGVLLDPMVAGTLGAGLTLWATFVPSFLFIFLGAPYVEALRENRRLAAMLSTITAAVVGVIANLALWFAVHVMFRDVGPVSFGPFTADLPALASLDWRAAVLASAAALALLRFDVPLLPVLAGSAAASVLLSYL